MRLPETPSIILNHLSFIYRNKTVTNTQTYLSDGWDHSASRNITTHRVDFITCFNFINCKCWSFVKTFHLNPRIFPPLNMGFEFWLPPWPWYHIKCALNSQHSPWAGASQTCWHWLRLRLISLTVLQCSTATSIQDDQTLSRQLFGWTEVRYVFFAGGWENLPGDSDEANDKC